MPGDCHIAVLPGISGTRHMSNSPVQGQIVGSLEYGNLNFDFGNPQDADGGREMGRQALPILLDPLLRTQAEIGNGSAQSYAPRTCHRHTC